MTGTPVSAPVMARAAFVTPRYPGRNNGLGLQTCLAQMSQLERNESDHFLSHVNRGLRLILGSLETGTDIWFTGRSAPPSRCQPPASAGSGGPLGRGG
jgi:hypothetical protein